MILRKLLRIAVVLAMIALFQAILCLGKVLVFLMRDIDRPEMN
jgi:hypothetical protein